MTRQRTARLSPRAVALACAGALLVGCASFVAHGEYAAYREVRLADDEHERLVHARDYLAKYPEGRWAKELRTERRAADERIWDAGRTTEEGLSYYLELFPDGAHALEARPRLAALRAVSGRRDAESKAEASARVQAKAEAAEQRRTWLGRAVDFWTRSFVAIGNWGAPIRDVALENGDFNKAFGRSPHPRCSRTECVKFYTASFGIPVPGATRLERRLDLLLRLKLREGKLVRAEILLPGRGFSRWYEYENRVPVIDEDPAQRAQTIGWALDRIAPVLDAVLVGSEREDVIPDSIEAPRLRAPNAPEFIEDPEGKSREQGGAPGERLEDGGPSADGNERPTAGDTSDAAPAAADSGVLEALLENATGGEGAAEPSAPEAPPVAAPAAPETIVVPASLYARKTSALRAVVFSASDDDRGPAFDGIYVEWLEPPAAAPPSAPPAGRKPARSAPSPTDGTASPPPSAKGVAKRPPPAVVPRRPPVAPPR